MHRHEPQATATLMFAADFVFGVEINAEFGAGRFRCVCGFAVVGFVAACHVWRLCDGARCFHIFGHIRLRICTMGRGRYSPGAMLIAMTGRCPMLALFGEKRNLCSLGHDRCFWRGVRSITRAWGPVPSIKSTQHHTH
ncbi:hypothetical protein EJ06DRAFT_92411 [Trichodelitschia bisporula]|uniref:Uncharacterized protein n=1 Tax=Trichodelitschia bisporula TaxID=703511 RepID=A0A6G1HSD9_9PEZI|nr:hypothetical protein EJ06DRAFT_92411 [Trichodelitschia bisporula]